MAPPAFHWIFSGCASGEEAESELCESQNLPEDVLWPLGSLNWWLRADRELTLLRRDISCLLA